MREAGMQPRLIQTDLFGDPRAMPARPASAPIVERWAHFSPCGAFRYELGRRWGDGGRGVAFMGVNPSDAGVHRDDPSVLRSVGFARRWKFDWLVWLNPFAKVSPHPESLLTEPDPIGPENADYIERALSKVALVIACWGNSEILTTIPGALRNVKEQIDDAHLWPPFCLGMNADGSPRHPLARGKHRIPDEFEPVPWIPVSLHEEGQVAG